MFIKAFKGKSATNLVSAIYSYCAEKNVSVEQITAYSTPDGFREAIVVFNQFPNCDPDEW